MIPLRDTIQSRNYPVVNMAIMVATSFLYLVETAQGRRLDHFIFTYGLVPARYSEPEIGAYFTLGQQVLSFFSFMFLHGGFWHLLGNMWSLYIFGDNVEDRLGPLRYLIFYVLCGFASGLSHVIINWHSKVPTIGASGAIAGVMGAYFLLYPKSRIFTLIPIFIFPWFVELPAFVFLGIWFLLQFISAAGTAGHGSGIAWWAHVGGFVFGMISLKVFLWIPERGVTRWVRRKTPRKKTPRLQAVRAVGTATDPHLYGIITITPREARMGSHKLVNIPWGFHKRIFRVTIPPDTREGTTLRLAGLGKETAHGQKGDLYLKVKIRKDAEK